MSLIDRLTTLVGADHVLTDERAMAPYLTDWRGRYQGAARCVVRPATTAEVAAVVRTCAEANIPMVPQGGNTSLCGAGIPDASGDAVLISLSRLNRIRAIDPLNNTITVEAGCLLHTIQEAAQDADRLFPLSLAAEGSCQIGGNLSTNAGGIQVLRYGNTRELTLGLEVVLPNGDIWNGLRALRKDNTGYDLKHLFIGAEGTLGLITAAVLKLFPRPTATTTAWLSIDAPQAAVALLGQLQSAFGAQLTACELISDAALSLVLRHIPATQAPLPAAPWYLLIELSGSHETGEGPALRTTLENFLENVLENALESGALRDAVLAQNEAQAARLWALRETISEAQKREGLSIKHDISLPLSRLAEFVERADATLQQAFPGLRIVTFGHVGDGNLHYNVSRTDALENAAFIALQPQVHRTVHDLVVTLGGSISAEHGIGQLKRDELCRYKDPVEMNLMRAIKKALDPQGHMNPGKLL